MIGEKLLDRYELLAEAGRGGMGVVYRARDPLLQRDVAVKMIPPLELTRESEERFQREAQLVAGMDHPAIVPIHDFGRHEGSLFFVMPWVDGTSLQSLIQEGALILDEVLAIVVQVAEALDYSHSRGVIHRDIKPANVMVSRDTTAIRARVLDFGLARSSTERRMTKSGGLIGTMTNLSPEQVASGRSDPRTDVYALGTVLYECLCGQPPFSGAVHTVLYRIVHEAPRDLRELTNCDEDLARMVHACLAKDPATRPQSGKELAAWFTDYRLRLDDDLRRQAIQGGEKERVVDPTQPVVSPLVGRRAEWAELQARLGASLNGECQFVLVEGEAGTGKSRLLLELENLGRMRSLRVLRGRFVDRENAIPYQGLCELIQDYFRQRETVSGEPVSGEPVDAAAPPSADFTDLAEDLLRLFPVLSEIRELRGDGDAAPAAEARLGEMPPALESDPTRLYELLARTLARLGGGRPLVLLLENLHQGSVSLAALAYIVRRLGPTPTLVVGTCRRTEVDPGHPLLRMLKSFNDDPRFCSLVLSPLGRSDFRRLVEIQLGSSEIRDELLDRLYEATEGNPFFGQELVRSLLETGSISRDDLGSWAMVGETGMPTEALPATIQQAVERRVERLDDSLRHLLGLASVLGRSFTYRDLENLVELDGDYEGDLDDDLDELVLHGILDEDTQSRDDRLHFSSGVVRDILYRELPRRRRRSLHRRHAYALEKRYQERLDRIYPQLVHHFSEGDVGEKTVQYALLLAKQALETFIPETAVRSCRAALEFVEEDDKTLLQGELLELLAAAYRACGSTARALREAERAAAAYQRVGNTARAARAALLVAETAWQGRQVDVARSWVDTGIQLAQSAGLNQALRRLLTLGATVANLRGEHQAARRYMEEAEQLAPVDAGASPEEEVPSGGVLTTALPSPINTIDPAAVITSDEFEVAANVFETLLAADPEGNLMPALCERWQVGEDDKTFELVLRPDVCFSDGWPLTGQGVRASVERSRQPGRPFKIPAFTALERLEVLEPEKEGDPERLLFVLKEELPIFPALLSDPLTAIAREVVSEGATHLLGTGPFRLVEASNERVVLERNPNYWRGTPPPLDGIVLDTSLDATGIAEGLRSGALDVARDLLPADLEIIQRDPRFRSGLVETVRKNVYFLLFNVRSPRVANDDIRSALLSVLRVQDLVWRSLGRFAQPAVCLLPPGVLGHDPGRRSPLISRERAAELLGKAGGQRPLRLRAAIHPIFIERAQPLLQGLSGEWESLGVEMVNETPTMEDYLQVWTHPEHNDFDLFVGRWNADFDDPDNFTFGLFHSHQGRLRHFFSSPETDELLERARRESQTRRPALYQRFEEVLRQHSALLPLFHDIDYRIAGVHVCRLQLDSSAPYVNYDRVGKFAVPAELPRRRTSDASELHIALPFPMATLDPAASNIGEHFEAKYNVFESLTRISEGAHVVPWLAAFFEAPSGGTYHFRLREKVRFHDGRRLTSRDVRYTFERLLRDAGNELHFLLLPIRGARALRAGEADALEGFGILSAKQFVIELEEPLAFFPALLTHPGLAIVPEGAETFAASWKDGCVGTGPFRVLRFDPKDGCDLEKNPEYWRPDVPRSSRLTFHFDVSADRLAAELRDGRLSVVGDLPPADVEVLRREPEFAAGYQEAPRLSTIFLALNTRGEALANVELRRSFIAAVDLDAVVREALGREVVRAHGVIPPGLSGHEVPRLEPVGGERATASWRGFTVRVALHSSVRGPYARFWDELRRAMTDLGISVQMVKGTLPEVLRRARSGEGESPDLVLSRWIADYPDADAFALGLLHSQEGLLAGFWDGESMDELIDKGRRETDPALRHAIYRKLEEEVADRALLLPILHEQTYRFSHPTVKGLRLSFSMPEVRYEELYVER